MTNQENSAHSYSEGSEVPLTEAQRIEKEAFERYPKKAINGFDFPEYNARERYAYIAGANAERERIKEVTEATIHRIFHKELKEERNKAIDDFYKLMDEELQTEPINRARYMIRLSQIKESIKSDSN